MSLALDFALALQEKFNDPEHEIQKRFSIPTVYEFYVEAGKKFDRIVINTKIGDRDGRGSTSVYAFVERETGALIKSAGWKAPAKLKTGWATKYNLTTEFAEALAKADPYGSFLYQ